MATKICDYWSASQIGTFLTCPIAYRNLYVVGMPQQPPNIYMVYGTAIHKALEINFKQKIKTGKDLSVDVVYAHFWKAFQKEQLQVTDRVNPAVIRSMELAATDSLGYYIKNIAPDIQPKEVEFRFEVKMKNFPITLVGYMDLITVDGVIRDYKTAGKDWKRKFSTLEVGKSMQLTLYAAAYRKLFKQKEKGLVFDVMPRCESETFVRETTRTDEQVLQVLKLATDIEKIVKLGVFVPNYTSCSQCEFRHSCEKRPIVDQQT